MTAPVKSTQVAKNAATSPVSFNMGFLDESGVGSGPYDVIHAVVNSNAELIDPATSEQLPDSLGQTTMANSLSVTIAANQSAVDVEVTGTLPAFASAPTVNIGTAGPLALEAGGNLETVATQTTATATAAGTVADTAYTGSGSGSLVALLKGVFTQLGAVVLGAGSALIGKVGIDQTTPGTSNGVWVTSLPPLAAGTSIIGSNLKRISTASSVVVCTPSSAYVAGYEVGAPITFTSSLANPTNNGILHSLMLSIASTQTAGFNLYLFSINPTNTTWADKTAPAINLADLPGLFGVYKFTSPDSTLGAYSLYTIDNINKQFYVASGASVLYGVLTTLGTPTFTTATDITVSVSLEWG